MKKQTVVWLLVFLVTFGAAYFFLPEQVPLYYSTAIREDRLASKYMLLLIPACVLGVHVLYYSLLYRLTLQNTYMQRLSEGFILFLTILAYLSFIRILYITL